MKKTPVSPPNIMEKELLRVLLLEIRSAVKHKQQIEITIDPYAGELGCNMFVAPVSDRGRSYAFDLEIKPKARKRSR